MKASKEERLEIESKREWSKSKSKIDEMIEAHPDWVLKITVILKQSVNTSVADEEDEEVKDFKSRQLDIFTPAQTV